MIEDRAAAPRPSTSSSAGAPIAGRAGGLGWLGVGTLATGAIAGVYFAFAVAILPGLQHASDRTYVDALNHINDAIENPVFFAVFFGAVLAPAVALWRQRRALRSPAARATLIGLILSAVSFLITVAVNVPLNRHLAAPHATDLAALRHQFNRPWVIANVGRTVAATAGAAALLRACVLRARRG